MNAKKLWIAIQIRRENGCMDALIIPVTELDNISAKLNIRGIVSANIFTSQKHAREVVLAWRDGFRAKGIYYWDSAPTRLPVLA